MRRPAMTVSQGLSSVRGLRNQRSSDPRLSDPWAFARRRADRCAAFDGDQHGAAARPQADREPRAALANSRQVPERRGHNVTNNARAIRLAQALPAVVVLAWTGQKGGKIPQRLRITFRETGFGFALGLKARWAVPLAPPLWQTDCRTEHASSETIVTSPPRRPASPRYW